MAYQQALSGLAAAASDLDVIGNNIANTNTTGFKGGQALFADMYANSLATAAGTQIGIGTKLAQVEQQFAQGSISTTDQPLDVAINGTGFFQMSNNGAISYSRDGAFQLDKNGYVVDSSGYNLMGYPATNGVVAKTAQTVPLQISTAPFPPTKTTTVNGNFNLDAQSGVPSQSPFDPTNSATYNYSTSTTVYDTLGVPQQLSLYFVNTGTNQWEAYGGAAGTTQADLGQVTFDSAGNLTSPNPSRLAISLSPTDGSTSPQPITLDLTGTTQYGAASAINSLQADGYSSGQLTNFTIGQDGVITGSYSNGKTLALGQVAMANFSDPNGLVNLGGSQFAATAASGAALVVTPGNSGLGTLQSGALEGSNVDLTSQLVDLITAQRNYQANAQTIKTQQTVDSTLLNL